MAVTSECEDYLAVFRDVRNCMRSSKEQREMLFVPVFCFLGLSQGGL